MKKVAAVIVTCNRFEKLKITIQKSLSEPIDHILVINNMSNDGTREWLDEEAPKHDRLEVIHSDRNLGGAGGFELGFREAVKRYQTDWLICYDDDAFPHEGTIENFKALELASDIGAVSAAVYDSEGGVAEMNRPSRNPFKSMSVFWKTFFGGRDGFHLKDEAFFKETETFVDVSSFVGLFIRTDIVEKELGYPRGELFIYADDVLYTLSLRKLGYKNLFLSKLKFTHDCGSVVKTSKHFRHPFQPLWKVYYTYRNNIEVFRDIAGFLFLPVFLLKLCSWIACVRFYDDKKTYLRLLFWAVKDGLFRDFEYVHDRLVRITS